MKLVKRLLVVMVAFLVFACNNKPTVPGQKVEVRKKIEMLTDHGTMVIELYNETPLHRDNFIKQARAGMYDSVLFHRVIDSFMIQGGDPDSKYAKAGDTLGNGGLDYKIPAEFNPNLYHKKGVLAAARDGNIERASSSTQFYIVEGKVFNDSLLDQAQLRVNTWLAEHYFKLDPKNKALLDSMQTALHKEDMEKYAVYSEHIHSMSKNYTNFNPYRISPAQREVYKTIGGTPHLDQNYTVYGEVIEGMEVIDAISSEPTGAMDRPVTDIRIISVKLVE
ncbi:peptidylprolyl isomerase [Lutimonas sp.]|uniref:peptidylprolyl isomerase n=1 Tax=Lutimonas sp. TaxID=1872403 RepID=UPI003D9B0B33